MRRRKSINVDVDVDIDIDEVIGQMDDDDLISELKERNLIPDCDEYEEQSFNDLQGIYLKNHLCDILGVSYHTKKEIILSQIMDRMD